MNPSHAIPEGTAVIAEGGVRALGELCSVLRSAGIDAALLRPPKDCGSGG